MKPIAQRMFMQNGVIFRVKHQSLCGNYLYFAAEGQHKLDPQVCWEFSAANVRPTQPMLWYSNDESFKENHLTVRAS